MTEATASTDLPLQSRIGLASRMAHALRILCEADSPHYEADQCRDLADNARRRMLEVRNELEEALADRGMATEQAECVASDYGIYAALDATFRAWKCAERLCVPGMESCGEAVEFRRHCLDAGEWAASLIALLLDGE